jgi:heme/copper-type cytochrome/quinol oxidase subunit 2
MLFQDPGTPLMEGIVDFHHDLMFIIIFIVVAVLYMISVIVHNFTQTDKNESKAVLRGSHHTVLEIV